MPVIDMIAHLLCGPGLSRYLLIQNQCYSFPRKIVVLAILMFVSLVLFQFGCFFLTVEAFKQSTPKLCILSQFISCLNHLKCWNVVVLSMHSYHMLDSSSICSKVLQFIASSFL